jgi:hypothetical protein
MTKGEVLRYAIAFPLRRSRKVIRGLKESLTEDDVTPSRTTPSPSLKSWRPVAAERGGAGGEAAIDMIDLLNWTEGIPRHPAPHLPFLSPGLPRPGLIFWAARALVLFFDGKEGATPSRKTNSPAS